MEITNLYYYPQYVEVISEWIYSEFIKNIRHGISYENIVRNISTMKRDTVPCTLIAFEKNTCLGTVSLFENDLKERRDLTPWLGALYVNEKYRSRGIAKKLIEETISLAKDLGYIRLYLRTEHASDYYRKLGWESIYRTIDEYNLETEVFSKEL